MNRVAIIPARGGSTRIPRKNIKDFHGKPIIAYSIRAALDSNLFEHVIVSTEDTEIMEVAQHYGADIIVRPMSLAENHIGTQEVMAHAMSVVGADVGFCIYPTAPMISIMDLYSASNAIMNGSIYAFTVGTEPALHDAGQIYAGQAWAFKSSVPLIGPYTTMIPIDPRRDCDINTMEDWDRASDMYQRINA